MYLNEIQNAKITWNDRNKNPFTYNDYGDHHNYRTALMQKEMDFIQEYQTNTIFVKSPFSVKLYLTYLNLACFFFILTVNESSWSVTPGALRLSGENLFGHRGFHTAIRPGAGFFRIRRDRCLRSTVSRPRFVRRRNKGFLIKCRF